MQFVRFQLNRNNNIISLISLNIVTESKTFNIQDELDLIPNDLLLSTIKSLSEGFHWMSFYWLDDHEVITNYTAKSFRIDKLINVFEVLDIKNKLFFYDNNLGISNWINDVNYKGLPLMIGITSEMASIEISERKFKKKFICLNLVPKPHRREIFRFLRDNHSDCSYLSFASHLKDDVDSLVFDGIDGEDISIETRQPPLKCNIEVFCNIVTETDYDNQMIHITEKIDKCFTAGQPFVLVSGNGYLKKLKELGFKTFDKWWDESYDDISDNIKRMDKIKETINFISKFSLTKCEEIYSEMIPILEHNKNHAKSMYPKYNLYRKEEMPDWMEIPIKKNEKFI